MRGWLCLGSTCWLMTAIGPWSSPVCIPCAGTGSQPFGSLTWLLPLLLDGAPGWVLMEEGCSGC